MEKGNLNLKTIFIIILGFTSLILMSDCTQKNVSPEKKQINALILASRNYGLNYFLMRDIFEQYGWNVTHTGVLDTITACPPVAKQLAVPPIIPDLLVSELTDITEYDCVIIPPGSGSYLPVPNSFGDLLKSAEALKLIKDAVHGGLPVYATCAGVQVLAAADVIQGKKVVGSPKFRDKYEAAGALFLGKDHPPSIEGNIITSARGLYYSVVNCQAIATALENRPKKGGKKIIKEKTISSHLAHFDSDQILWARTYGGANSDGGQAICETHEGGFLITGYTFSHGSCDADILVIKTDSEGNRLWTKIFGGYNAEYGYGCMTVDDGYLITGYTASSEARSKDVILIKLDSNGNQIYMKEYGGDSWDGGKTICKAEDGNILICGFTHSFGAGEEDVYLIKTDSDGNEIWSKTYGGHRFEMGNSILKTTDGCYLIGATTGTYGKGNSDFYLIKIDADGNELWLKSYGSTGRRGYGFDWCSEVQSTADSGFILVGYTDCQDILDAHLIKIESNGNEMWSKSFGNKPFYDYGNSVEVTDKGHLIVAGTTKSIGGHNDVYDNDILLTNLDTEGRIQWEKIIAGPGSDWASSLLVTNNGDIMVLGYTDSYGNGSFDVCLIKVQNP